MITLHKDLLKFLKLLNANSVRYLLVGGYAVAVHGHPRYTGDMDIYVEANPENSIDLVILNTARHVGNRMPMRSAGGLQDFDVSKIER